MITAIALAGLVCLLLLAAVAIPSKPRGTETRTALHATPGLPIDHAQYAHQPQPPVYPVDMRSLRQRQIDEDAALLSDEFARYEDARYRSDVRDRAARAFGTSSVAAVSGPSTAPIAVTTVAPRPVGATVNA